MFFTWAATVWLVLTPIAHGQVVVVRGQPINIVLGDPEIPTTNPSAAGKPSIAPLVNVDDEMSGYIVRAREMIASKDYANAIDILQALLNRSEQCFVFTKDPRRFVSLAVRVRAEIGRFQPEGMKIYRGLYDARAEVLFRAAADRLDEAALRSVVDRYMYTSYGSRALEMLGGVLFDRGEFSQAARCWRRVVSVNGRNGSESETKDEAVILAKIAVAHHFAGESKHASKILDLLIKHHPKTVAAFGGGDENVVEFVRRMFTVTPPQLEIHQKEGWSSLAGAPDSVAVMSPCEPVLTPRWSTREDKIRENYNIWAGAAAMDIRSNRYPPQARNRKTTVLLREGRVILVTKLGNKTTETVMPAMIHPIAVGKTVIYRAAEGIVACDLLTGERLWKTIEFPLFERKPPSNVSRHYYRLPSNVTVEDRGLWTVTAGDGKVFALGKFLKQQTSYRFHPGNIRRDEDSSVLAAFSISSQGQMLWQVGKGAGDSDLVRGAKFLTAPTYLAGRLYVIVEYVQSHHLVCLNAENGEMVWETPIAQTPMRTSRYGMRQNRWIDRSSPPAVSAGKVFVVTNAGVIAAFEADTGRPVWAYQYDPKGDMSAPPNPIVVTRGRAICLPADCNELLALRTDTGRLDWSVDRRKQRDLTAIDGSRLLLSGERMIVIDAASGRDIWKAEDISGVHGRPAVTTDAVLASGSGEVIRVSLADFDITRPPLVDPGALLGNLVCVDGKMIASNAAGLSVYSTFEDTHAELTARIKKVPPEDVPNLLYHRAVNAFSAGYPRKALVDLLKTRQAAERRNNNVLLSKTSQMLYRTYVSLADHKASSQSVMLGLYGKAAEYAYSDRSRGEILIRLAKYYSKNGAGARAAELAQEIIEKYAKVDLADVKIGADADGFVRDAIDTKRFMGYELGNRMIKDLISRHGRGCYGVFDTKATSILANAVASDDPDAMVRVADTYRHSTSAPMALLRAAESRYRQALRLKSPDDRNPLSLAGGNLNRLMREYPDSGLNASAEVGLAMIYQRVNPRLMWLGLRGLEEVLPDTRVSFADVSGSAGEILKRLISQLHPSQPVPPALPGPINPPLKRIFRGSETDPAIVIRHADGRPVRCDGSLFLVQGGRISRFNPSSESFREAIQWETAPLLNTSRFYRAYSPNTFSGGLSRDSTVLVVGCRGGFVGVDVKTGKVLWRRSAGDRLVSRLHSMTMGEDRFVALTHNGDISVIEMRTGKEIWKHRISRQQMPWRSAPQISGGLLLVCYGRTDRKASVYDMRIWKLLGSVSFGRRFAQAHLTADGLLVTCDGKSLRLIEPILGMDRSVWTIDSAAALTPAILYVTNTHVLVSPVAGNGTIELRSITEMGRIVRTFQTRASGGKPAIPLGAFVVGSRLYVVGGSRNSSVRKAAVAGRVFYCRGPTLHAFDMTTGESLWSADLTVHKNLNLWVTPIQIGRGHVGVIVKRSFSHPLVAMIIETGEGRVVQKLSLPSVSSIHRAQRNFRNMAIGSPVIAKDRLVVETHKGLEVHGKVE